MSEFHRMITYLYLYEHGTKRHNTGFAKIEKRDGQCLIEIHLKNTGHNIPSAPVYFYTKNGQKHPGILVGTIGLFRGNGDFKSILKGDAFTGSNYTFQDVKGIFIPLSEEIMFVSQWDDNEFVRENFVEPGTKVSANKPLAEKPSANTPSTEKPLAEKPQAEKPQAEKTSAKKPSADTPLQVISPNKPPRSQALMQNPSSAPARLISAIPVPSSAADLEAAEAAPKQTQYRNTICVRLELKDIRLLPKPYWYLGNNSFLLHGFFNYRYLILGATEVSEKKRWFIGIPGIYQNPERVMATLFGFPEFRNEKSVPVNTGEFGYWYRYLN